MTRRDWANVGRIVSIIIMATLVCLMAGALAMLTLWDGGVK